MELEHRSPKSRYLRTSRKDFELQLSRIERRQARIHRIRQKLDALTNNRTVLEYEQGPDSPTSDYHIGKTQNHALDLGSLARQYGSLATKVFFLFRLSWSHTEHIYPQDFAKRLKEHLLPRILALLKIETPTFKPGDSSISEMARDAVLIKDNRIFAHKLARFYYTTYDVRLSEDVINPRTSHCDVMLLSDINSDAANPLGTAAAEHPFLYGRVIGIYHVNVIYVGLGMKGYEPIRFEFLHVRWFRIDNTRVQCGVSTTWAPLRLDLLSFPPATDEDAFGFLDPSLVLRSCHLIPAFALGKKDVEKAGHVLLPPRNGNDWNGYYVNRCDKISLRRPKSVFLKLSS